MNTKLDTLYTSDGVEYSKEIIEYYEYRWEIEVSFRYKKQRLGLSDCEMMSFKGIERFWILKFPQVELLRNVKENIVLFDKNSGIAKKKWSEDKSIDALIIWKHWENEIDDSKFISVEDKNKIYRPALISLINKAVL